MERPRSRRARRAGERGPEDKLRPSGLIALGALAVAACSTPTAERGSSPGPASPPQGTEGTQPELALVESAPLTGGPQDFGLTGSNKPNGIQYRLRQSVPASTPDYVPRSVQGLELWISEAVENGWLAFYRERLGSYPGSLNSRYHAALYGPDGSAAWQLDLDRFLSAPTDLEIQDIRLADGDLYFNEACQSYSSEAGGRCSSLVRVDPQAASVVWRTRPLVSNDIFIVHGRHVVTGYGFTTEPDSIFLVDRSTGRVAASHPLDSAHSYLEIAPDGRLVVITRGRIFRFALP